MQCNVTCNVTCFVSYNKKKIIIIKKKMIYVSSRGMGHFVESYMQSSPYHDTPRYVKNI